MAVVSAVEEVLVGVEGYDDDVEGLQVKGDMEVFGRGVRLHFSCNCDSAAGKIGSKIGRDIWKVKRNLPITSEGVELVPLRLLTPHFLTLLIRLKSVAPPFVGVAGVVVVVDPEATLTGTGVAKTEG